MSFRLFLLTTLILSVAFPVQSQGTNPTGKQDGAALFNAAKKLSPGVYQFKAQSGNTLTYISAKTTVMPEKSGPNQWVVSQYDQTLEKGETELKYFAASVNTTACLEKTISTRWTVGTGQGGYPDAAVLWQTEVGKPKKSSYGGYTPIFTPKQLWLAVPDQKTKGAYKIVSASHLYDMIPRCIADKPITGGTTLSTCKIDTEDTTLLWTIESVSSSEQKLQQCPKSK